MYRFFMWGCSIPSKRLHPCKKPMLNRSAAHNNVWGSRSARRRCKIVNLICFMFLVGDGGILWGWSKPHKQPVPRRKTVAQLPFHWSTVTLVTGTWYQR